MPHLFSCFAYENGDSEESLADIWSGRMIQQRRQTRLRIGRPSAATYPISPGASHTTARNENVAKTDFSASRHTFHSQMREQIYSFAGVSTAAKVNTLHSLQTRACPRQLFTSGWCTIHDWRSHRPPPSLSPGTSRTLPSPSSEKERGAEEQRPSSRIIKHKY